MNHSNYTLLRLSLKFQVSLDQQDTEKQCNPKRFIPRLWSCENCVSVGDFWKFLGVCCPHSITFNKRMVAGERKERIQEAPKSPPSISFCYSHWIASLLLCWWKKKKKDRQDERYFWTKVIRPALETPLAVVLNRCFSTDSNALCMGHQKQRGLANRLLAPCLSTGDNCILFLMLFKDYIIIYKHLSHAVMRMIFWIQLWFYFVASSFQLSSGSEPEDMFETSDHIKWVLLCHWFLSAEQHTADIINRQVS